MRIKFSLLLGLATLISVAVISCKAKKGAGSANVRTLSLKYPANYTFSFAGKTTSDATVTTKELASVDKIKILSNGKDVPNLTVKFKMKIMRGDSEAGAAENDGTELSSQAVELLKGATAGDKINFEAIRITPQGGEAVTYPPMSFVVK